MPWSAGPPTGIRQVASASIGSGNSATLIQASANVKGIQLWSLSISSVAAESSGGAINGAFTVEDQVLDTHSTQYLATEIGLTPFGKQVTSNLSQDMSGIVVPAGAGLTLTNGGAGGTNALRRCSATVVYSMLF